MSDVAERQGVQAAERVESPGPLRLAWRRFRRSKIGIAGGVTLIVLYVIALFAGFFAPYNITNQHPDYSYLPPQSVHIFHQGELMRPFVYALKSERDPVTYRLGYVEDTTLPEPIRFFYSR